MFKNEKKTIPSLFWLKNFHTSSIIEGGRVGERRRGGEGGWKRKGLKDGREGGLGKGDGGSACRERN